MLLLGPDRAGRKVLVDGSKISSLDADSADAQLIACSDALITLGRVNAHTHLYSALAPLGMPAPATAPKTFLEILERIWWRLDRALDERSIRASARLYVAQALLSGTTSIVDHHESPNLIEGSLDLLAQAFDELGGRALLTYGATERNEGRVEARRGLEECARFFWSRGSGLVRGLVGLHASFTVSDETIREAGELARSLETAVHVHVAEDLADVTDARARGFNGPLERLLSMSGLPARSILAHGVHLDDEEARRARDAGLWLVQNPRSNANNHVGYPRSLGQSDRVALGTDGFPSSMEDEERALQREAVAHGESLDVAMQRPHAGRSLIEAHFDARLSFDPGAEADLVVVGAEGVRHVVVAGQLLVSNGKLTRGDLEEILAEAHEVAPEVFHRMQVLPV